MKKIFAIMLVIVMMLTMLCGCHQVVDENGVPVAGKGRFKFIELIDEHDNLWIAYDMDTKIVYYYDDIGHNTGVRGEYYLYENGAIYGAVYEDGEIKPVPFASIAP